MNLRVFIPLFSTLNVDCGVPAKIRHKIEEGEVSNDANIKEQPWLVSLGNWQKNNDRKWMHECAGSLITEEHVITSAHCFSNILNVECDNGDKSNCQFVVFFVCS